MATLESSATTTLQVIDTQLYADSVEWCPFPGMQDILLCGTYQLLEAEEAREPGQPQVRVGQLQVFQLHSAEDDNEDGGGGGERGGGGCLSSLTQLHCLDMPGILDIKWARQPLSACAVCGLVNAKGQFHLWSMGCQTQERLFKAKVLPECTAQVDIGDCIGLSLDWAAPCEGSVARVVTSDSTGGLTLLETGSTLTTVSQWHAHDFEAWICAFDQWNHDVIYSGSDDCKLKVWDLRVGASPVSTNSRFTMGVCSIQSSPQREHLLAVGSYDENLRLFDRRQMREPVSVTGLGGGVWRVKWDPFTARYILTATMHNGFHILDTSQQDGDSLAVVAHNTNHASLAYGVDWCRLTLPPTPVRGEEADLPGDCKARDMGVTQALLASCSFYDHSLQLWRWRDCQ